MTLIPDDAHVMLAAAVSTRNIILITDTIMCITDLVAEIQSRFTVAVKPGVGTSMTFGSARIEHQTSFPCSTCDRKCKSVKELTAHSKTHTLDEDVHSATQRLHSLTPSAMNNGGASVSVDQIAWSLQSAQGQSMSHSPSAKPVISAGISPSAPVFSNNPIDSTPQPDDSASLKCPVCSKTFSKIFQLNLHLSRHQESNNDEGATRRTYSCRFCTKEFNHMSGRNKHERFCKPGRPQTPSLSQIFKCKKCKKPYADNANRLRHERMCRSGGGNHPLSLQTPELAETASPARLIGGASGGSIELPISVNNYKLMASSAVYMKVLDENGRQTNMFSCVICAKLLQTRSSLESHYMSHLGIKPHACQWCSKRFTDPSNWRKHQRGCIDRPTSDVMDTSSLPSMAPPTGGVIPQPGYEFPGDGPLSVSTSPSTTGPMSVPTDPQHSSQTMVKLEAVDISSDTEMAGHIFNTREESRQDSVEGMVTEESPAADNSVKIEVEPSENDKDIITADSVVVDSALSWFVEDKEQPSPPQNAEDGSIS